MKMHTALLLLGASTYAMAQTGPGYTQESAVLQSMNHMLADNSVSFTMVPRADANDAFAISLGNDGNGTYQLAKEPQASMPIHVNPAVWLIIEAGWKAVNNHRCETKLKNIAKTGTKTITYALGPSAPASCDFDYTDDKDLSAAANEFTAIAETMRMGERLKHSLRYDRLGLDAEMDDLVEEVKNGNAIEVQNIASVLQLLVDDDRVMERVKRKAARLLEGAGVAVKNYTP